MKKKLYIVYSLTLTQNIKHKKVKMWRRDAGNYVDKHCKNVFHFILTVPVFLQPTVRTAI
jgi:hypothetical protein